MVLDPYPPRGGQSGRRRTARRGSARHARVRPGRQGHCGHHHARLRSVRPVPVYGRRGEESGTGVRRDRRLARAQDQVSRVARIHDVADGPQRADDLHRRGDPVRLAHPAARPAGSGDPEPDQREVPHEDRQPQGLALRAGATAATSAGKFCSSAKRRSPNWAPTPR